MAGAAIALQLGGGVFSAFLQVLLDKLSSPLLQHLGYMFKVEDKLQSLGWTLSKIDSLVSHAEMLTVVRDPGLAIWLRELKDVARDVEDVLDDFSAEAQSHYNIGKKIDDIKHRLADIANERRDLISVYKPQLQTREWRATSSIPTERYVFGRSVQTKNLITLLLNQESTLSVIPIVGMGGLGKTTLVREVYNNSELNIFNPKIWVCVSDDFNVRRITEEVVEAVPTDIVPDVRSCTCRIASWDKLQTCLKDKLSQKKFLLVLDDMWSENRSEWERLCAPLSATKTGGKIIITTRSKKVADIMGTTNPFFLDPLEENDCWDLFKNCAFKNNGDEHPKLEAIGRDIVKRLNGVPLAAKTIGGLLYSNYDEETWRSVLHNPLWKLPEYQNNIMPVLRLSYQQMPAHLKLCFAFCSLFPKGSILDKHMLVRLWMAQGYIQSNGKKRIEELGEEYFDELVCRSFFHKNDRDCFLMHDLMHDLAQSVSTDECVIIDGKPQIIPHKVLHGSLHFGGGKLEFKDLYKHKSFRTLLYLEKKSGYNFSRIPGELFKNLKYIRALDLKHSHIQELPSSIGFLIHLRYLDLSNTNISSLPKEVGDLCNLQTMLLVNCNLVELPNSMNKLTNLRNFKGKTVLLSKLVGVGNLKYLQELDKFEVSAATECNIAELKDLTEIRGKLHISRLENVKDNKEAKEASLENKRHLHSFELEWDAGNRNNGSDGEVLEGLQLNENVKTLKIKCNGGDKFPSWLSDKDLPNLQDVSLVKCQSWEALPPVGSLKSLKVLEINGMTKLDMLVWGDNEFPSLEVLRIYHMTKWVNLGTRRIPSLHKLEISYCPSLQALPTLPPTLEELKLSNVGLGSLPSMWGCSDASSSSSSTSSRPSCLSSLSISDCPKLISLRLGLLQEHHNALKSLKISNCDILEYLPDRGFSRFSSLTSLTIGNCPLLASLPEEGGLPSSLQTLVVLGYTKFITNTHSLINQFQSLKSLSTLSISTTPGLTSLSKEVLTYLTALEMLTITSCENLETLGFQVLPSLKNLVVTSCPRLTSLTDNMGLQQFIPLRSIKIRDCALLCSLPTNLKILTQLEYLGIRNCPKITSWPEFPPNLHEMDCDIN